MVAIRWQAVGTYVTAKLAAAAAVFLIFAVFAAGFDLYGISQTVRTALLWPVFFGYAVVFSMVVDLLLGKCPAGLGKVLLSLPLYILGGCLPFLLFSFTIYGIIAGSIGSLCALVYYGIYSMLRRYFFYSIGTVVLLTSVLAVFSTVDFTRSEGWTETRTEKKIETRMEASYQADFAYFHGRKEIPVELRKDQVLRYKVDWVILEGGYGFHLLDEQSKHVGMIVEGDDYHSEPAEEDAAYRIVLTGDKARGAVQVTWTVE